MSAILPEDPARKSLARLAHRLLAEAEASPELIGRSTRSTGAKATGPAGGPFAPMALLSDPAVDIRRYLEDLVRIAVGSARQAEDVSSAAREATGKMRRGMAVAASFAAIGVLVGVAGFTASRSANVSLTDIRGQVGVLQSMQQQAHDQLADIAARTPEPGAASVPATRPPPPPAPATPPNRPSIGHYTVPWPDARPPVRRVYMWHSSATPPVVPSFVAALQRDLQVLFR